MKGTFPSQASRDLPRFRFTATECQGGEANLLARRNFILINSLEGVIMVIVTVGIDLAKNVFGVHGVNEVGKPALVRPRCHAPNCSNALPICRVA